VRSLGGRQWATATASAFGRLVPKSERLGTVAESRQSTLSGHSGPRRNSNRRAPTYGTILGARGSQNGFNGGSKHGFAGIASRELTWTHPRNRSRLFFIVSNGHRALTAERHRLLKRLEDRAHSRLKGWEMRNMPESMKKLLQRRAALIEASTERCAAAVESRKLTSKLIEITYEVIAESRAQLIKINSLK